MTEVVGEANDENEHPLPSISQGSKQCLVFTVVSHVIQLFLFHIHISDPLKKQQLIINYFNGALKCNVYVRLCWICGN